MTAPRPSVESARRALIDPPLASAQFAKGQIEGFSPLVDDRIRGLVEIQVSAGGEPASP